LSEPTLPGQSTGALPAGLSEQEAATRLAQHGPNELTQAQPRTVWHIAGEAVREPMLQLLVGAGLIYLVLGDVREASMLLAFVLLTLAITLVQEWRTERVLEALRDLSSPRALVLRAGQQRRIAGREVVVGDLMLLAEGDRVAADARLLQANDLQTDESLLTGEAAPVRKVAAGEATSQTAPRPGGDDQPWVYAGSLVVRGQGLAEVTATGGASEIGRIGLALGQIQPVPTALQGQTRQLVRLFAAVGLGLSLLVALLYWWSRGGVLPAVLVGITLAMSMMPQEFPLILTVFMAMGAWRISQKRVLVRRASAIEALGSATVLCTDKTGTLTQNRMTIEALHVQGQTWLAPSVADTMGKPGGEPGAESGVTAPTEALLPEAFHTLLEFGILASEREPFDPMEKAFWALGAQHFKEGHPHWHPQWALAHEYALSPQMLAMSHVWQVPQATGDAAHVVATKGAPEAIAELCHLDEPTRTQLRQVAQDLAAQGLRVLGVARAVHAVPAADTGWPASQHDFDFEWLGLVGLRDPLRSAVPAAVQACRAAGIRVAMITGDYPATALAIARQAGIDVAGGVLTGDDVRALSDAALRERLRSASVFARVMPEQKLRIVQAFQAEGQVVAMTGDGVNDAPSLKSADIGVAMGARGTDVAREASAIVLLDDDFGAIVQAVSLGRRIDDNLRKAMAFVLAVHVPIAGLSLLPLLMGWPMLFMPVHIAFLELIIDPVCSIVFEAEPEEPGIMQRPPRQPGRPLLARSAMVWSLLQGGIVLAVVAGCYAWLLHTGAAEPMARAAGFLALVLADVALILSTRSFGNVWQATAQRPNRALGLMLALMAAMLALVLWVPALRALFHFAMPDQAAVVVALGGAGVTLLVLEALKWLTRARRAACVPEPP
jgi:Ca2+-transporting ATPase